MPGPRHASRQRAALLTGGALVGLLIAATDLVTERGSPADQLPPGTIARVGSRLITQPEFDRVATDLATDKRTHTDGDRHFALQRMIDEELLVQRGVELGFPEAAPVIRKALAAAVVKQVVAEAETLAPGDEDLRNFYASDAEYFALSERWQVRWLRTSRAAAETASTRSDLERLVADCNFEDMTKSAAFDVAFELPTDLLPHAKLVDYMGPTLARRVAQLQPGQCSEPVRVADTYHVLYLAAHQPSQLPDFDKIKDVVEAEFTRRAGEQALLDYLKWLRNRAEIVIDEAKLQ